MSFPVILGVAIAVTLAVVALVILAPAWITPVVTASVALGVVALAVRYMVHRSADGKKGVARAAHGLHPLSRVKAVIEGYNVEPRPDATRLVDYMLAQGVLHQASDIHLLPYRDYLLVRYRVDGIITDVAQIAAGLRDQVTNRVKVMAKAVTYVKDRPQDGRLDLLVGERDVDLRVAFMPTLHGERVVMRILDQGQQGPTLANLGFSEEQRELFAGIITRPQGMVILNGPTGSGKTTTIYAALRTILEQNKNQSSIYTLEDPIEYDLQSINQTQIEETQGFTFAQGLRTMLRQDPDVIMVGEMRDLDTSKIAIQAGMTGHLIITTVHANNSAAVFVRLTEMGADPHSLASAATAVVAQRLVRLLCPACRRAAPATPGQEAKLGVALGPAMYYVPAGCAECGQKGFAGRMGVFEILVVDDAIRELVAARTSPDRIHRVAVENGMTTLMDHALALARAGETSLDEVLRVLPPEQRRA